jgi:hypothetical protein
MNVKTEGRVSLLLVAGLAVTLAACGTAPTAPSTLGGELLTVVVADTVLPAMEPGTMKTLDLELPQRGSLELTVSWLDQQNDVVVVVTEARCPAPSFLGNSGCRTLASESRERKDGEERNVFREAAGVQRIWIVNRGPGIETVKVTARLTYRDTSKPPREPGYPRDPQVN